MKGADVVMSSIVQYNDWLEEEVRTIISAKGGRTRLSQVRTCLIESYPLVTISSITGNARTEVHFCIPL